jgi:hypothetical protein
MGAAPYPMIDNSKSIENCRRPVELVVVPPSAHGVTENAGIARENSASVISKAGMNFCHFRQSAGFRLIGPWRMGLDAVLSGHYDGRSWFPGIELLPLFLDLGGFDTPRLRATHFLFENLRVASP